jgi:hypothetical protein
LYRLACRIDAETETQTLGDQVMTITVGYQDPDEDAQNVRDALRALQQFVEAGPYLQPGNNVCWFCFHGIGNFGEDQHDAGHQESCLYLTAWQMQSIRDVN